MRCVIRWRTRKPPTIGEQRAHRLRSLFQAALATQYYRRQGTVLPGIRAVSDEYPEAALEGITPIPLDDFVRSPLLFYRGIERGSRHDEIRCPLGDLGRTAILGNNYPESELVRCFPYEVWGELADFRPDTIAGPVGKLQTLAEAIQTGQIRLPSLRTAAIAFSGLKYGCLKPEDRDLFWRIYQVPIFEQFLGFGREVLAWECEAHEGLHIRMENGIFQQPRTGELVVTCLACPDYALIRLSTEMVARIERECCGCGDPSPRLIGLRRLPSHRFVLAAGA